MEDNDDTASASAYPDTAQLASGFKHWPNHRHGEVLETYEVIRKYKQGYAGAFIDPVAREQFYSRILAAGGSMDGEQIAYNNQFAGSGEGKLSIPFIYAFKHWPKCWPCPGQTTGDCVSHGGKNSALVLIGVESALKEPDPDTGLVEDYPVVSELGEAQGVVACENIYRARGHSGQGANCSSLQDYVTSKGGILLRQKYPELDLDLEKYNASIGIPGGKGVPESWNQEGKKHQIRTATGASSPENVRDFVANGYPIWVCSGLGWSSTRDENGYSRQQGGWGHSWVVMGYDDRDIIKQKYGGPLFLYNHDWGNWNRGGTRIMGTEIDIPGGSFWADAKLLNRCECTAMSNMNGWPARILPPIQIDVG